MTDLFEVSGRRIVAAAVMATILGFTGASSAQQKANEATDATKAANAALLEQLPFGDKTSFELAHKGFIAPLPAEPIKGKAGNLIWDPQKYDFIKEGEAAPDSVNPSLWRPARR